MTDIFNGVLAKGVSVYEYQELVISTDMLPLYTDNCNYFGWELQEKTRVLANGNKYKCKFKRDGRIANKTELTRLQREFDSHIRGIESMEQSKAWAAVMVACMVGIIGCAFLAGAVFAYLGGMMALCIALAIPGFIGGVIPYWCYKNIAKRKTNMVQPHIDQKYEEAYTVCERAYSLTC